MRFLNILLTFLLCFYVYPALSSNNFNLIPIEVSKNVFIFLGDNNDANEKNLGTSFRVHFHVYCM